MVADLSRRRVLQVLGAISAAGLTGCPSLPPPGPPPVIGTTATWIDVHCHVFNALDIPIVGFVTDVVLEGMPEIQVPILPLIISIALVMDGCSWSAEMEANAIRQGQRPAPLVLTPQDLDREVQAAAQRGLTQFRQKSGNYQTYSTLAEQYLADGGRQQPREAGVDQDAAFLQFLAGRANGNRPLSREFLASPDVDELAAQGITAIPDEVKGVYTMAYFLTERRLELVERLSTLPKVKTDSNNLALYCPAMVDYSYWLHEKVTTLNQQVDVMSAIAAMKDREFRVHPWISFCPWRQLCEPKQFQIVKDAVRTKGFIGVKLYPVMGFRPYGNAAAGDADKYPPALQNRLADLDMALANLYDWCMAENVPIMAHCSYSQFPNPDAGKRGAPSEWAKVFSRPAWRDLRVNLGHIGGIWDLATANNNGWVADAVGLIRTYPNVYADVADDSDASEIGCTPSAKCPGRDETNAFGDILNRGPGAGMTFDPRLKVMYGTDWVMLSRDLNTDVYLDGLRDNLAAKVQIDAQNFLGVNAARFLELDKPPTGPYGTQQRLLAFYQTNGLPTDFFKRWQT